jgi:hypothetical protein
VTSRALLVLALAACGRSAAPPAAPAPAPLTRAALLGYWDSPGHRLVVGDELASLEEKRACAPRANTGCVSGVSKIAAWRDGGFAIGARAYRAALEGDVLVLTAADDALRLPRWRPPALPGTRWRGDHWTLAFDEGRYRRVSSSCDHDPAGAECAALQEEGTYRLDVFALELTRGGTTARYDLEWPDGAMMILSRDGVTEQLSREP